MLNSKIVIHSRRSQPAQLPANIAHAKAAAFVFSVAEAAAHTDDPTLRGLVANATERAQVMREIDRLIIRLILEATQPVREGN